MRLVSVNIGMPREVSGTDGPVRTGIFKTPVSGKHMLRRHNLDGDGQADLVHHGGEFKAVYAYPVEHYAMWRRELDREDFVYGQFGENFTVEGMPEEQVHIGDVFRVGAAVVEVTQPRVPCFKSALRMGLDDFPKRFLESERSGFYLRVVGEGEVEAGASVTLVSAEPHAVTVHEVHHLHFFDKQNVVGLRRALEVPALSPAWRKDLEALIEKAS